MKKNPSLIIAAGKGCFTCCLGCYQYFGKTQVPTDDLIKFIKKYKEKFNLEKITLAGGDPMTRGDIVYLVNELYKFNLKIYMDTVGKNFIESSDIIFQDNGTAKYINPKVLKGKISKIGIPMDGYTTEQINCFRKKITLDETQKIISILNDNDYNICINTVVNKNNINNLKEILEIIKRYKNISQWQLFQYSPIGDLGYKNRKLFEIDYSLFERKINELIKYNQSKIIVEGKSNSYRKLNYILVNSDGIVWQPSYNILNSNFENEDANDDKKIIGTIYDKDIYEKIKMYLNYLNENIIQTDNNIIKILSK